MTQSKSVFDIFVDGVTESTHDYLAEQEREICRIYNRRELKACFVEKTVL
ncbi:MAG: hypothetical protein ACLRYY_07270 [Anaerobutyricum soehngenii]